MRITRSMGIRIRIRSACARAQALTTCTARAAAPRAQVASSLQSRLQSRVQQVGLATVLCGPVLHPDGRFRTVWNVVLCVFICYCGIAVPLEIAFEPDMVEEMCGVGSGALPRQQCTSFLAWFWCNVVVDVWFLADIVVNMRTGCVREARLTARLERCMRTRMLMPARGSRASPSLSVPLSARGSYVLEGHFVDDDKEAAKQYLKSSFALDLLGSFPVNFVQMALDPSNLYGDDGSRGIATAEDGSTATGYARTNRLLRLLRIAKLFKLFRMVKLAWCVHAGAEAGGRGHGQGAGAWAGGRGILSHVHAPVRGMRPGTWRMRRTFSTRACSR